MRVKSLINKYENLFNAKVYKCGLILNPKCPWSGCNLAGFVDEQNVIEIKCSSKLRGLDVSECYHDKNFVMILKNDELILKLNNNYFIQNQGIIAITELQAVIDFEAAFTCCSIIDFFCLSKKCLYV